MLQIDQIYNIDCLQGMKSLLDASIDCVVTDPPYKVTRHGSSGTTGGVMATNSFRSGKVFVHNDIDIEDYLSEFYRVLKDGSHCYIMCNNRNLTHFLKVIDESDFHFIKSLIWDKQHKVMGKFYMNRYEYILMLGKGRARHINDCGEEDIISIPNERDKDENGQNLHDCQKPVPLMQLLIEQSTQPNDIVLDPFMGSGTTALACQICQRHFVGYEIDKTYYDIAVRRIKEQREVREIEEIKITSVPTLRYSQAIAQRIQKLMDQRGMTHRELAEALYKTSINHWLNGHHNFTLRTLERLSEILGEDIIRI